MKERLVLYGEPGISGASARVRDCVFATIDRNGLSAVRIIDVMLVEEGVLLLHGARQRVLCGASGEFRRCCNRTE